MKTRYCKFCGKNKPETTDYFYRRGPIENGKFCSTCIECKLKYDQRVKVEKKNNLRARKFDGQHRHTLEGFTLYMLNRPQYFRDIFRKEPTVDNIKNEYAFIKKYIDGPSILKELGGFGDVRVY
jgi:hypothetical protein